MPEFCNIFGRPFVKRFALCYRTVTLVYCGQTVGWIKMKLGMQVGLGPGHIVLDGNPAPLPQRGTAPNLRPISIFYCRQAAVCIRIPLGMEVGLSLWRHCVRWGPSSSLSRPMSVVTKQLDGLRCHLVWR